MGTRKDMLGLSCAENSERTWIQHDSANFNLFGTGQPATSVSRTIVGQIVIDETEGSSTRHRALLGASPAL